MPTTTKAGALSRVTTHFKDKHSDASRLTTARDLAYLISAGMTYRQIVAEVTTRDTQSAISTKTISLYVNALKDAGEDATPESFGAAYRERHAASRAPRVTTPKGDKPKADKGAATPGNETPEVVTVSNASTAIAAFEALMRTVETLPAKDRQRVTAHITRAMSRRFAKAA